MSALVFNCDYNGLGLIHALGRAGIPVYALDSGRSVGTYSKYAKYINVPNPLMDADGFIHALMDLDTGGSMRPLLLPTNDHWAEAVARNSTVLKDKYTICTPDAGNFEQLINKYKLAVWAKKNGIPVPDVWTEQEILESQGKIEFPIAVKAVNRREIGNGAASQKRALSADKLRFVKCQNKEELLSRLEQAKRDDVQCYCQKIVNGDSSSMRTIGVFANKGKLKGLFYGKKVRGYPATYGDCIVGEALPVTDFVRNVASKIVRDFEYTGIAEIELMADEKNGELYLIEVNPRSWSWVGICSAAGVNLALIAYQELVLGEDVPYTESGITEGNRLRYVKVLQDFMNVVFRYGKEGYPQWKKTPFLWLKELRSCRTVLAEFPRDDFRISLYAVSHFFSSLLREMKKR